MFDRAACKGLPPEVFYFRGGDLATQVDDAKAVCAGCDVRDECLELALDYESQDDAYGRYGVWGGLLPRERAAIVRSRRRSSGNES